MSRLPSLTLLSLATALSCLTSCHRPPQPAPPTSSPHPTTVPAYMECHENEAETVMVVKLLIDGRTLDQRTFALKPVPQPKVEPIEPTTLPDRLVKIPVQIPEELIELHSFSLNGAVQNIDGISSKTGRGVGSVSQMRLHTPLIPGLPEYATTRPVEGRSPLKLTVSAHWDYDESTGNVETTLTIPLGRPVNRKLSAHATLIIDFHPPFIQALRPLLSPDGTPL